MLGVTETSPGGGYRERARESLLYPSVPRYGRTGAEQGRAVPSLVGCIHLFAKSGERKRRNA